MIDPAGGGPGLYRMSMVYNSLSEIDLVNRRLQPKIDLWV